EALRYLIFRIIIAIVILLPVSFYFADDCIRFLVDYSCPPDFTLRYFSLMEPLFVKIKISLLTALFIALPYIAYTVWKFIVPALYPEEKRTVKRLAFSTWLLFHGGVAFCFFFIIPAMMRFSLSMQSNELHPAIGLSNYVVLVGMLLLGFGIMFQLPIVVFFLALSGMVKLETIKKLRAIVLIVILTLSALLTPPDIFSQLMMAIPTYLLFELSLLISSIAIRGRRPIEVEAPEDIPDLEEEDFFQPDTDSDDYSKYYHSPAKKRKLRYMSRK
ncbi:MAG: twin-arginine translocase subunit TatC, partial [Victivallaceae bacterium]|nr:twin-arginine translocase subunit TatC [Victivallaceae bacterium]